MTKTLLLLGGTSEAMALAKRTATLAGVRTINSLAGRTRKPVLPPGEVRFGGFGGSAALARFIANHEVTAVIDATHPYAVQISANAASACDETGCPRLILERPPWEPQPGDRWQPVSSARAAAVALLPEARALLTTGHRDIDAFAYRDDVRFVVRLIEAPDRPLPLKHCTLVLERGPFDVEHETALLDRHGITVVVTKNSGGKASRAKLDVARENGIDVVMIDRPEGPAGDRVATVGEAVAWLECLG